MTISGDIQSKASSKFTIDCWVGDEKAFLKLIEICRQAMNEATRLAHAVVRARRDSEREAWMKENSYISDDARRLAIWESRISDELESVKQELQVHVTATHKKFDQEVTGAPELVLASLDYGDLMKVNIGGGHLFSNFHNQGFGLEIAFSRRDGCVVSLQSPDSDWIMLTNEKLRVALIGRRPWYWWLRRYRALIPLAAIPLIALVLALGFTLDRSHNGPIFAGLAVPLGIILFFGVYGIGHAVRRLLPAFELVPTGSSGMGKRNLSLAGTAIAWLLATLLPLFLKF